MEEFKELADLIESYRLKIADLSDYERYYYIDFAHLNSDFENVINAIKNTINTKFAAKFMHTYSSDEEMLSEIEEVLQELMQEANRLKGIYNGLKEYEPYDEALGIYRKIVAKILEQIDIFLLKLENLILRGAEGNLRFELDIAQEVEQLKEKLHKKNEDTTLHGFLAGLGLGWLIFGGDDG